MDRATIFTALESRGISYFIVEHGAAETTEQADAFIEGYEGVRTKSLFLTNRKKTRSYLVIMDDQKDLDLGELAGKLSETRLSFGSPQRLHDALGLEPGVVSPFGMLDPEHRSTALYFDKKMLEEKTLTFHPGDNRATIFIGSQDLLKLFTSEGIKYQIIDV